MGLSVSYVLNPLDRVPGVEEQPPAGSLVVVEHDAPVTHALQVAPDLLRLAVLFPRHELQLHGLLYPVVEFHQASSTLDVSLSYRTLYATTASVTLLSPSRSGVGLSLLSCGYTPVGKSVQPVQGKAGAWVRFNVSAPQQLLEQGIELALFGLQAYAAHRSPH